MPVHYVTLFMYVKLVHYVTNERMFSGDAMFVTTTCRVFVTSCACSGRINP